MAKVSLTLDTRKKSKSTKTGLYPIVLRVFHRKSILIRTGHFTSPEGWNDSNNKLKKSVSANRNMDIDIINAELDRNFYLAKKVVSDIGLSVENIDANRLAYHIKSVLDNKPNSEIKKKVSNEVSLSKWSQVLIGRKEDAQQPGTARWYREGVNALVRFNDGNDLMLYDITVPFLKNFEAQHLGKGNSNNTISIYLRAVRSLYNAAIAEGEFDPLKNPFSIYKIPSTRRTKKRGIDKSRFTELRKQQYPVGSELWHTKNYLFVMLNCRGMNLIDLAKLKISHITGNRIHYGRSKTGDPLSLKISQELSDILSYYLKGKEKEDFIFPIGYDGSSENYVHYESHRRRINKSLKKIADDAGIQEKLTTYTIRHSWASIAKHLGVSTELISESLGHHSLRTTEIYLRDFPEETLDEINELVLG